MPELTKEQAISKIKVAMETKIPHTVMAFKGRYFNVQGLKSHEVIQGLKDINLLK